MMRPDDRARRTVCGEIAGIRLDFDSCEPGLQGALPCLHSRWSASLCGSLTNVARAFGSDLPSRELWIGTPLRNDLPLGHRAGSFQSESTTSISSCGPVLV